MIAGDGAATAQSGYPRSELLVEPASLALPGATAGLVVLDARPRPQFEASRVPGARWVDAADWAKSFADGKDPDAWSARIGRLGIASGSKVVVYDASSSKDAARVWWILTYWGVEDARLLDGGWPCYEKAGLRVEKEAPKAPAPIEFKPAPKARRLATKGLLLESLKDRGLQIVDARSSGEFCGLERMKNQRGGAMPGAKNLDWTDLLDKSTQRFKGPDELRRIFRDAGIDLRRPTAAHCQSGGRSSVMVFALELMGAEDVRNYHASWAEWGNADDTPIVTPQPPSKKK
jgi:thiosulfate/3-mercaptopyruvate sulfurtransferase